jgi:peroxiredoxin
MPTQKAQTIPSFRLPASTGQTLELESFRGKVPLAIFFVIDVDSEDDRRLILQYDRLLSQFGSEAAQVLGVARATARELRELADELGLAIPLLADAASNMARDFGAAGPDGHIRRVTVVADKTGAIVRRLDPAPLEGQPELVLAAVRGLNHS